MQKYIEGRIWVLGDDVNTDIIVPSRVLTERDREKMLAATLEVAIPDFYRKVKRGDIIVAGKNFGSGSSREEAVYVLKELGIAAVIAESFSRIYYRNCINQGLPPIEPIIKDSDKREFARIITQKSRHPNSEQRPNSKQPYNSHSDYQSPLGKTGDIIAIDFKTGIITNKNTKRTFRFKPYPDFVFKILEAGGMIPYLKEHK